MTDSEESTGAMGSDTEESPKGAAAATSPHKSEVTLHLKAKAASWALSDPQEPGGQRDSLTRAGPEFDERQKAHIAMRRGPDVRRKEHQASRMDDVRDPFANLILPEANPETLKKARDQGYGELLDELQSTGGDWETRGVAQAAAPARQQIPAQPAPRPQLGQGAEIWREKFRGHFDGDPDQLLLFLVQLTGYLDTWGHTFPNSRARILFVLEHLGGEAASWAAGVIHRREPEAASFAAFMTGLQAHFEDPFLQERAESDITRLTQGKKTAAQYGAEFKQLADRIPDWPEAVKIQRFCDGLRRELMRWMVLTPPPNTLQGWITLAGAKEFCLRRHGLLVEQAPGAEALHRRKPSSPSLPRRLPDSKGGKSPRDKEKERRKNQGLCLGCGEKGHFIANCPLSTPVETPKPTAAKRSSGKAQEEVGRAWRIAASAGNRPAMASPQEFQTFVFLDIETTGLPCDQPCMAELCLFAVNRHSLQGPAPDSSQPPQPPRILDKLTLCIDPQKPFTPKAEEITGLSNQMLAENCKPDFDSAVVEAVRAFLDRQAGPICLVAHNGLGFDFPLLRTELWRVDADLPPETGCLDTLPALKDLDQAASRSYRLGDVFRRLYGQDPVGAHSAEGDVLTLLLVFLAKAPELIAWGAVNARSWGEVRPMYPPSSISY